MIELTALQWLTVSVFILGILLFFVTLILFKILNRNNTDTTDFLNENCVCSALAEVSMYCFFGTVILIICCISDWIF